MKNTAEEYKKHSKKEWELTAPSGFKFKVRRPSAVALLTKGVVPTRLYSAAMMGTDLAAAGKADKTASEDIKGVLEFMGIYLAEAIIEPKTVVGKSKENEISVDDLDEEDMFFLFNSIYNGEGKGGKGSIPDSFRKEAGSASA